MGGCVHGSLCAWESVCMGGCVHGSLCAWESVYMEPVCIGGGVHGRLCEWCICGHVCIRLHTVISAYFNLCDVCRCV